MNWYTIASLMGGSLVPTLIAFAASYYHKKGTPRIPVSAARRALSFVVIYVVVLVIELALTLFITLANVPNPQAYEGPFLIVSGLLAYFAGKKFQVRST
jgi:hypothetical protein